jgi:hypothetical protein
MSARAGAAWRRLFRKQYEYEEEIYLALDGTATVNVNASVAALDALRGATFDVNPRARLDRGRARVLRGPGTRSRASACRDATVAGSCTSRRLDDDPPAVTVRAVRVVAVSTRSRRRGRGVPQVVGAPAADTVADSDGRERARCLSRPHPEPHPVSQLADRRFSAATSRVGAAAARSLSGVPLDLQVQMEPQSILYSTLLLFAGTIVAAAATFGVVDLVGRAPRAASRDGRLAPVETTGGRPPGS